MDDQAETLPQTFPIYYPGSAEFQEDTAPGAGVGATAVITVPINTRPHMLTGIRLANVYAIPEELRTVDGLAYLKHIDQQQEISSQLAQQNVVVRPTLQKLVTGDDGIHWHPFELPYPFRGGNNIVLNLQRLIAYPDEIVSVTVKAVLVGWAYVDGKFPPAGPPSTGFPTG